MCEASAKNIAWEIKYWVVERCNGGGVRDKQTFVRAYSQRSFQPTEVSAIPYTAHPWLIGAVLTANESVSSFRFTFPKFVLDLHLPSAGGCFPLAKFFSYYYI